MSPTPNPSLKPTLTIPKTTSSPSPTHCPHLLILISEIFLILQQISTLADIRILITTDLTKHSDLPDTDWKLNPNKGVHKYPSAHTPKISIMICSQTNINKIPNELLRKRSDVFSRHKEGLLYVHGKHRVLLTFLTYTFALPAPHPAHLDLGAFPKEATLIHDLNGSVLPTLSMRDQMIFKLYFCGVRGQAVGEEDARAVWTWLQQTGGLLPMKWDEWEKKTLMLGLDDAVDFTKMTKEEWLLELGFDDSWWRYLPPVRRTWFQFLRAVQCLIWWCFMAVVERVEWRPSLGVSLGPKETRWLMLSAYLLGSVYVFYLGALWVMDASSRAWMWVLMFLGVLG
ncbi:uncharacterized protein BO80DRAFT_442853 [Aspergillus ibericus CBS 121593]|uniref:Uncharacterized protein n=1 Tax=Aspergillus ibericus CBS 121593 TaxID=1448316 RepID=A0A395H6J3_9EURO|nr:hypothetical protein BO80DRAFT_442853 [Aspergillus ibericus CBS 121593]RAL03169.1 hypothetical protein BO80DRAFT_442853 [Aspergillus ibericus CBS 121593]